MKGKAGFVVLMICVVVLMFAGVLLAQEDASAPKPVSEDTSAQKKAPEFMITFGLITKISPTQVSILEYDYDTDEEVEVSYVISGDTKFENVGSVAELKEEDFIELVYISENNTKIAKSIKKEAVVYEEEVASEEQVLPNMVAPEVEMPTNMAE